MKQVMTFLLIKFELKSKVLAKRSFDTCIYLKFGLISWQIPEKKSSGSHTGWYKDVVVGRLNNEKNAIWDTGVAVVERWPFAEFTRYFFPVQVIDLYFTAHQEWNCWSVCIRRLPVCAVCKRGQLYSEVKFYETACC